MDDQVLLVNSASFEVFEVSGRMTASVNAVVDLSNATYVSGTFAGSGQNITLVTASYIAPATNITSSAATSASHALAADAATTATSAGTASYITFAPLTSTSASWASSSVSSSHALVADSAAAITFVPLTSTSASWASSSVSASHANNADTAAAISFVPGTATSASYASSSTSASYINPGTTFYQVSGSNGIPASYIEPYDYSKDNVFRPTSKEGRTYWDHKWVNWKVWQDTDYSSSTAAALNLNLGRELNFAVHNPGTTTLARTTAVYISGSQTSSIYPFNQIWPQPYKPDVYPALADGTGLKSEVIGLVRNAIPPGHDGYVIVGGTMHNSDVAAYGDIGTKVWLSITTPGGLTTTKPGQPNEIVHIGYIIETGSQGSILVQPSVEPAVNAYAGMTSVPTITDTLVTGSADFTSSLYVSSASVNLYTNILGSGIISQYLVAPGTVSLAPGGLASYIYATTNGATASYEITTDLSSINQTNRVPVATVYRADVDAHWVILNQEGLALANKLNSRLLATEPFSRESGLALATTGSRFVTITEGALWTGATRFVEPAFDSRNTGSDFQSGSFDELHIAYHSASVWVTPTIADGKYENRYYDDGTNLAILGPNSYSINYVFRIFGENAGYDEDAFIVLSNVQYSAVADAQASNLPANIPAVLSDISLNVGRIIIQSGSNTASLVESAFGTTFGASVVTDHENLSGLLGGTAGQHYHLLSQEWSDFRNATGTGVYVRATNPIITGSITTASYVELAQTAAFVTTAQTASFVETAQNVVNVSSASFITTAQTASYVATASYVVSVVSSSYSMTASWALNAINGGTTLTTGSTVPITASWSEWATNAVNGGTQLTTGSTYPITASAAVSASHAITSSFASAVIGYQTALTTGSTIPITASWAEKSTTATSATSATTATTSTSASWVSASVFITTAQTASYVAAANISGVVTSASNAGTSSWANNATFAYTSLTTGSTIPITASWAVSSSAAIIAQTASFLTRNRTYEVTASFAVSSSMATTSSYATVAGLSTGVFSRGATFYDAGGIGISGSFSQSLAIWRAPFNCTLATVYGLRQSGSNAFVDVYKNWSTKTLTNPLQLTATNVYSASAVLVASSASFVSGDVLVVQLVSASGNPTAVTIQCDFTKP